MNWFKKKPLPQDLQLIENIVDKFLHNPSVKKLISPLSEEYLLIDEDNSISLCISGGNIKLANHAFIIVKNTNIGFTEKMQKKIRAQIELERQELKKQLFENEINLLEKINNL